MNGGQVGLVLLELPVWIGISIFSYRGEVQIGLIADENLCPRPDFITDRFAPEFRELAQRVNTGASPGCKVG